MTIVLVLGLLVGMAGVVLIWRLLDAQVSCHRELQTIAVTLKAIEGYEAARADRGDRAASFGRDLLRRHLSVKQAVDG